MSSARRIERLSKIESVQVLKMLKLCLLTCITVALGILSYPTWKSLLPVDKHEPWAENDTIQLIVDRRSVSTVDFALINVFGGAARESLSGSAENVAGLSLRLNLQPNHAAATLWIQATPRASHLIDDCIARITPDGRRFRAFDGLARATPEEALGDGVVAAAEFYSSVQPADFVYYKMTFGVDAAAEQDSAGYYPGEGLATTPDCMVDSDSFWVSHGSRGTYISPEVRIAVIADPETPSEEGLAGMDFAAEGEGGSNNCLFVSTLWGQGIDPGDATPRVEVTKEDGFPYHDASGFNWDNCVDTGLAGSYTILQEPTSGDITDNAAAEALNRSLFFAGVFAGLLGALAIEIFNGAFDVLETPGRRRQVEARKVRFNQR